MLHSNFKERSHQFNLGVAKFLCGQTFDFTSERDWGMKLCLDHKFCSKPAEGSRQIRTPRKATMLREQQPNEDERMRMKG